MKQASILAAVDQFPQDESVLARAFEAAAQHNSALVIVHILNILGPDTDLVRPDTMLGQAALAARGRINAALATLGRNARYVDICIAAGAPALRLIEICDELSPALVVMRAHQRVRIVEKILGSTTDRLIASGVVAPVLVVKRPVNAPYSRITVTTDGSPDGRAALALAAELFPAAALHLVQAVQIPPQLEEAMLRIGTGQDDLEAERAAITNDAAKHLSVLCAAFPKRATFRILRGDPASALISASRSAKSDLMVLGPGRASLIKRAFIGSVTRRLLREAASDVLICRPAD